MGHYDKAVERFQKALELDPNFPRVHGLLGSALFQSGKIDQAIEAYKKQIARTPNVAQFHFNLGLAYQRKGLQREAITRFERAVEFLRGLVIEEEAGLAYWA